MNIHKAVLISLLFAILILAKPWQALQNSWTLPPSGEITIQWHGCLEAGGARVILTTGQMWEGYTVENLSTNQSLLVATC